MTEYSDKAVAIRRRAIGRGLEKAAQRLEEGVGELTPMADKDFLSDDEMDTIVKLDDYIGKAIRNLRTVGKRLGK